MPTCYRLNVFLLKSHTLRLNRHCVGIRRWGHQEGPDHEGGAFMQGISALIKGTHMAPSPLPPHEAAGIGPSPD